MCLFQSRRQLFMKSKQLKITCGLVLRNTYHVSFITYHCHHVSLLSVLIPPVVVAVVGIGHVSGMVKHWDDIDTVDLKPLLTIPPSSRLGTSVKWLFRSVFIGCASWMTYKLYHFSARFFTYVYNNVNVRTSASVLR